MNSEDNIKSSPEKGYDIFKKRILFFAAMTAVGTVLVFLYLAFTGNTAQKFEDIIFDSVSVQGLGKTAERNLFYIFSLAGVIIYTIYYFYSRKKSNGCVMNADTFDEDTSGIKSLIPAFIILNAAYYFIYKDSNPLLLSGMIILLAAFAGRKERAVSSLILMFACFYSISGIYRLYAAFGGTREGNYNVFVLISLLTALAVLMLSDKHPGLMRKGILAGGIFIPLTLLVYISSNYLYNGEIKHIAVPLKVTLLVILVIAAFMAEAVLKIRRYFNAEDVKCRDIISYGMCVSIMAFNRFGGTGAVIPYDLHHPFENVMGFSQIFEYGQKAFEEYIPISGMYSVVQGFFLWFFGHDRMSNYYLSQNIFYLLIILVTVFLLRAQIRHDWVLFIALMFMVIDYNRVALILPIMLLLAWPKLIENRNLWLKAWFLTSFVHALYYPVFGAAVCIGFLPLGIWQIFNYIKSKQLAEDIKKPSFWIWWIVCFLPAAAGIPWLLGTVRHTLAMGGQTVCADGVTRFGQEIASDFLPYIKSTSLRLLLYYFFSYMIVISIVWAAAALCLAVGCVSIGKGKLKVENPVGASICAAVAITMLISFSYTVIRFDAGSIYARSAGVVYALFVMLILIAHRYVKNAGLLKCLIAYAVFLLAAVSAEGFLGAGSSIDLSPYYTVPDGMVYVENDEVERLGTGFIEQGMYDLIHEAYESAQSLDEDKSYFGIFGYFGLYYLSGTRGAATMETYTVKGYDSAKECIDLLRENGTVVGNNVNSVNNYHLYKWLATSGEYVWDNDSMTFKPNDGSMSEEEVKACNKDIPIASDAENLGLTAASWGESMESLENIFEESGCGSNITLSDGELSISFDDEIDGNDADFMYIEFDDSETDVNYSFYNSAEEETFTDSGNPVIKYLTKKNYNPDKIITVAFTTEDGLTHSFDCGLGRGKLLVPLGGLRGWLNSSHKSVTVSISDKNGDSLKMPQAENIRFLRLDDDF